MTSAYRRGLLIMPLLLWPMAAIAQSPAMAQMSAPTCTAPVAPTGDLAPWTQPVALAAAGDAGNLPTTRIELGQAALVTLLPTPQVHYPLLPEKPGSSVSHGGLMSLHIREAGKYRVALGSSAWLDVVSHDKPVTAIAHGHGPACTGIHKMVDFPLQPGEYVLQVSAAAAPQTTILVVRLP